ncbi:MAG TPA: universal stress protein, partial [Gemmatimonadales bacterium]
MTWGHVVVATDGPGPGMHALQVATELSRRASVRLTLVTVLRPGESVPSALRPHEPLVLRGDPGIEIARYAEDSHADVIVLGRRAIRYGR